MKKSKLKILLKYIQDSQNIINENFLFWSYKEFELTNSKENNFLNSPKTDTIQVKIQEEPFNKNSLKKEKEILIKDNETKVSQQLITNSEKNIHLSTWNLIPMSLENSKISLPINEFTCLKNKLISYPKILCAIFMNQQENNEVLFIERLNKTITRLLFSSKIIVLNKKENLISHIRKYPLNLVPMKELTQYKITAEKRHQQIPFNDNIILPLENFQKYTLDFSLKQDLWKQLKQINLQNMQK